jgi:hypothetical protein
VSSLLKIQAGRVSNVAASTYVGDNELLWYDETGILRLGDGVTPGGIPLNFSGGGGTSSTIFSNLLPGVTNLYSLGSTSTQWRTLFLSSSTFFVGGNAVTISNTGTLFINGNPVGGGTTIISTGTSTVVGFTGSAGVIGYTGSPGIGSGTGTNNLVWTSTGTRRLLTGYIDPDGTSYTVRETQLLNGSFILNLAGFTPVLSSSVSPSNSLNWDIPCTGFTVNVVNPIDFSERWISSVRRLVQTAGFVTTSTVVYSTTGPNPSPVAGSTWSQTFNTNNLSNIRPVSTTIAGGTASVNIHFNYTTSQTSNEIEFIDGITTATVTWATPTLSISMGDLSGNNFLLPYFQTSYTIAVSGISVSSNYSLAVTGVGGLISNVTGNGNLVFTTPIHKNSSLNVASVAVAATFNRPSTVTGTAYSVSASASDNTLTANFTYPSFWLWTNAINIIPTRNNIVVSYAFVGGVTVLGNQVKNFAGMINNTVSVPRVFWFGVRASAVQPTSFQTGVNASLLNDVTRTAATVLLFPDITPSGYNSELYNLYGLILQPGNTYVSIS